MTFQAPLNDLALTLRTVGHSDLLHQYFPELSEETTREVLEAAGRFAERELAPLNQIGDREGARYGNGTVSAPRGFAAAYGAFAANGWNSLSASPEFGGQGLSKALELAVSEIVQSANLAFGLCPILTQGAIEALTLHGSERQKRLILPRLVSGEWTGTMNLTEAHAGSDLAALTTRAVPAGAGKWHLQGEKIFITWGDHDCAENIAHLVLARTPDGPPGIKGISLFLATKRLVNDDGSLGALNRLRPASIEHKMGIHGSPTCVMLYENAEAELVGKVGDGLPNMFTMMNAARLQVAAQGVGIAERAFQRALAFSQERRQGRAIWSSQYPAAIFDHPDIRRMLIYMKGKTEAARAICLAAAVLTDVARLAHTIYERSSAKARLELLTPIAKAWSTNVGVEVASLGIQVHGGMGYIEESGAAQHLRDARILPIYEGTNGIQANDLVTRKLSAAGGEAMLALCADIHGTGVSIGASFPELQDIGKRLADAAIALREATEWMLSRSVSDRLGAAVPYLEMAGDVIGGWMLARIATQAEKENAAHAHTKAAIARIYANAVLATASGTASGLIDMGRDLEGVSATCLGG